MESVSRFPIVEGGKSGYIDERGTVVIPPRFDGGGEFHEGRASFSSDGKFGFVDETGEVVVPPIYQMARDFAGGRAAVAPPVVGNRMLKWGFIDRAGDPVWMSSG